MPERPKYDWVFIVPFTLIGLISYWAIYWNTVVHNISIDVWGAALVLIGTFSLIGIINHVVDIWKRRKYFVWETLKNG